MATVSLSPKFQVVIPKEIREAVKHQLSMGDAIIWQTAQVHGATLNPQEAGLSQMPNVSYKAKR